MRIALLLFSVIVMMFFVPLLSNDSFAHRSGCHRWHSCPSDSGSYGCGDLGYECRYSSTPSNSSSTTSGVEKQLGGGNILNDPYTGSAMDKARNILGTDANATANATGELGELMNRADNVLSLASNTGSNATQEAMRKTMDLLTNVSPDVPNTMSSASTDETVLDVNEMANELINAASNASANATNATGTAIDQER